jgi:hypothetical protein
MEGQSYFMTTEYDRDHIDLRTILDGLAHSRGYGNYYHYWHLALTSASPVLSGLTVWEVKVNCPVLIDTEQ